MLFNFFLLFITLATSFMPGIRKMQLCTDIQKIIPYFYKYLLMQIHIELRPRTLITSFLLEPLLNN